jgi:septal ring factor EnvC (AmiA/AmiB activator)
MSASATKCLLLALLLPALLQGQESPDPEALRRQIEATDKLLAAAREEAGRAFSELSLMERQTALRAQLVASLSEEMERCQRVVAESEELVCALSEDMARLQAEYALTARRLYMRLRPDNFWLSLLAAESLSEALFVIDYYRHFARYRRRQLRLIVQTQAFLSKKSTEVQQALADKERLAAQQAQELATLEGNRAAQKRLFASLRDRASAYRQELERYRRELKRLLRQSSPAPSRPSLPADAEAAAGFGRRRGRLPWPVPPEACVLVGRFGPGSDPFGNRIVNDGIYLRTPEGQEVQAVFAGRVSAVQRIPLSGWMVVLEHGPFRSVYANLEAPAVEAGQQVEARQRLGRVRSEPRSGESLFHFLIFEEPETFLDPENWLSPL